MIMKTVIKIGKPIWLVKYNRHNRLKHESRAVEPKNGGKGTESLDKTSSYY